jgi:DNA-binding CsgD family transcriptional regulator
MKRHVLILGLVGGLLITVLKWSEYQFLVVEHSFEIYGGLIAAVFAGLGIWIGLKLTGRREEAVVKPSANRELAVQGLTGQGLTGQGLTVKGLTVKGVTVERGQRFVPDEAKRESVGITRRELEILELVAGGLSNREIADKLFVSENTVKTHCSRAFDKLGAKRRTQAVQRGKELGLLP